MSRSTEGTEAIVKALLRNQAGITNDAQFTEEFESAAEKVSESIPEIQE